MNLKAGDLAMMVSSSRQENIGRVVRVVEFFGTPTRYQWDGVWYYNPGKEPLWVVEAEEPLATSIKAQMFGAAESMRTGPTKQSRLMPLSGDFEQEQQQQREELTA